ncbi:MAG TPA: TerC family protein [Burkholderiaceae bacterium]|nr:TerC family protein [Burkholderiaceae bacterium]
MELVSSPDTWTSLINIMLVNVVLSGDNAVVIALAANALPAKQQRAAIVFGSAAAIAMRIVLTVIAISLLTLPYLKIVGGTLLFYIAIKLMLHPHKTGDVDSAATIGAAIKTILLADLIMSLDNVLGVAAASHGNLFLLAVGLALSIPIIVFGSTIVLKIMMKFPVVVPIGAALLAYLGGEMLISDPALAVWRQTNLPQDQFGIVGNAIQISISGTISALVALAVGAWHAKKGLRHVN